MKVILNWIWFILSELFVIFLIFGTAYVVTTEVSSKVLRVALEAFIIIFTFYRLPITTKQLYKLFIMEA
jgi:hypothetical protein